MDGEVVEGQSDRRRKAYALATDIGLTRDERIALAQIVIFNEEITSWRQLSDGQMGRLLDALEGYVYVNHMLVDRLGHRP